MTFFSSHPQANAAPSLTFIGPDASNTIHIENAQGMRTPIFTIQSSKSKPNLSVYRITPTGQQEPLFTSSTSSMSGNSTINIHNREIKLKSSSESLQEKREFPGPMGKLGWCPSGMGDDQKLKDKNGTVLAKYKMKIDSLSGKEPRLEICVPCDDALVDLIVATGLVVYKDTVKEIKQAKTASKIIQAVLGA